MNRASKSKGLLFVVLALALLCPAIRAVSQTFRLAALVARESIDWNGYHVAVDSFSSANPNWSTGGLYDPAKSKDNGDVIVGASIIDSIGVATANIHGHVYVGVGGGVALGIGGGIGERSWQTVNPGQIQPGWLTQMNFIAPPDNVSIGSGLSPGPGAIIHTNCIDGTDCHLDTNYYDHVLYTGNYYSTTLSGDTIVVGKANLYLPNGLTMGGPDTIRVASTGSLSIYVGTNSSFRGNGIINRSGFAMNFRILCTSNVANIHLNMAEDFTGVIIAPQAVVHLHGTGYPTNHIFGALVANSIRFDGNINIHFDESLIDIPARLGPSCFNGDNFTFGVTGARGFSYVVEASTDLTNWTSLVTNISPFTFADDSAANYLRKCYRAVRVR